MDRAGDRYSCTLLNFFWGGDATTMDWQTLYGVCLVLIKKHKPLHERLRQQVQKVTYLYRRFVASTNQEYSLRSSTHELHRARPSLATDPRDHVFTLLGHFSAPTKAPGITLLAADYSKSELEVFHEVAIRMLRDAEDLEFL